MPGPELSIDRYTASSRNTFTSVRLDRLVDFRDDPGWVAEALAEPSARIVPQWRGRSLLNRGEPERPVVYLAPGEFDGGGVPPTLLGRDSRHTYFAAAVDDRQQQRLLAAHPGAAFLDLRLASIEIHEKHAGILAYAKALLYWQYRNVYCGSCGAPNRLESAGHRLNCSNPDCGRESFPRIDPAIIVLVTNGDACLLGHNARWPERRFSTLAGYVEPGESLEDTVVREVYEEACVRVTDMKYVSSQPWPFPASTMCGFYAEAASRDCSATDEMEEVRWFTARELAQAIESGEIRVPPPVSVAFRLISDWYEAQCGGDLEGIVRGTGGWAPRKGLK